MTIVLEPDTELRLREKANKERQDVNAVANAMIVFALEWEMRDRAEAIAGVRRGDQAAAEGRERSLADFFADQRVRNSFADEWPYIADAEGDQTMPTRRLSSDELWRRGDDWYDNHIRPVVETEDNIGKLINIDVESGDYEIGTDRESLELSKRLIAKNSDAQIIELRIGYPAVSVLPFPRLRLSKNP